MFYEDAVVAARALDLALTHGPRTQTARESLCAACLSTPRRLRRQLVRKGFRSPVEQVDDPKQAKGLVKREVVRVVCRPAP